MRSGTLDATMNAMLRFLALLMATAPLYAVAITTFDVDWSVTEISTGNVLCGGSSNQAIDGFFCQGIVEFEGAPFEGITIHAAGGAGISSNSAGAEATVIVFVGNGYDPTLFDISASASVDAAAIALTNILGGSGPGLFLGFGDYGGGSSVDAAFVAGAAIQGLDCHPLFGACNQFIPFSFGNPVLMEAFARASASVTFAGFQNATGSALVGINGIFDLNRDPVLGGHAVLLPEPGTWAMLFGGFVALGLRIKFRKTPRP